MNNISELKELIQKGEQVYYGSMIYKVVIDFDGDLILKCTQNASRELITEKYDMSKFIYNNTI
jgi:hypothetical protein